MLRCQLVTIISILSVAAAPILGFDLTDAQIIALEKRIEGQIEVNEAARTQPATAPVSPWVLRSKHFVFGMPVLKDNRYNVTPPGQTTPRPGVSVLVREGFVIGHCDRMLAPLWVCQRWTQADRHRMDRLSELGRPWKIDMELPAYARVGTSYAGNDTLMDRGHMARHEMNRAWGEDSSEVGCLMSNSAPQHRTVNRGAAWRSLEDVVRDVVKSTDQEIEALWLITGTFYRDDDNPPTETPEEDFERVRFIGDGFGVPWGTYRIVGWFDSDGIFLARGYVFTQSAESADPANHLEKIDVIEERTGLDFFSLLKDDTETNIENVKFDDMWGAE